MKQYKIQIRHSKANTRARSETARANGRRAALQEAYGKAAVLLVADTIASLRRAYGGEANVDNLVPTADGDVEEAEEGIPDKFSVKQILETIKVAHLFRSLFNVDQCST